MSDEREGSSWKRSLTRPGVWALLFGLAVAFFNWPLLDAYLDAPLVRAYLSLFVVWGLVVACLFVLCRVFKSDGGDGDPGDGEG